MLDIKSPKGLTRRELLSRSTAAGASFVVGAGFVAGHDAAWATELTAMQPDTFATLVQMARDIYPHDHVADRFYVAAVKGYDADNDTGRMVSEGIAALDMAAKGAGYGRYLDIGWEADRVAVLRGMQDSAFFQQIRGGLITGLYNQKEVWPLFGYEGESFSKGGYLENGFDDIDWV